MSFATDVKNEICRLPVSRKCCAVAETYGALLFANEFSARSARIVSENIRVIKRMKALVLHAFGFEFDIQSGDAADTSARFVLEIKDRQKLETIVDAFGFVLRDMINVHVNLGVIEESCCYASFLRGAFLAGGSVTDPRRNYHLELRTNRRFVSGEVMSLLADHDLPSKTCMRSNNTIIYFKRSALIEEFLTLIGAPVKAMDVMNAKIDKELQQKVNRRVNCDTANVSKTVLASEKQIELIWKLKPVFDDLPDALRETAQLRIDNPELTLAELAAMCTPPVTKSCMNHRIRKLLSLAKETEHFKL